MLSPPKRGLPSDIADEIMVLPEGTRFNSKLTPYMVEPMNLINSRHHKAVIFCAPARTGKSISLVDAMQAFIIYARPSDNLTIFPTESMARRYARMRFDRLVKNSPELKKYLTTDFNKDNVLNKSFNHGMASWFGSPTPTNLSGSDYRYCFYSDVDRGGDENADGDIFAQLIKRNQTFLSSGMTMAEGSPSRDILDPNYKQSTPHEAPPVAGILGLYNQGDRRMFYWECPHCSDKFKLPCDMSLFMLPNHNELIEEISDSNVKDVASKYSHITCVSCGSVIDEHHKTSMNRKGEWRKEVEDDDNEYATFWLSGYAAKFQSWSSILTNYLTALVFYEDTGNEEKLKAVLNVDMASPYMPKNVSDVVGAKELEERAISMGKRIVPDGGRYLIASIDVQKRKFVVQVEAWGVGETRWIIDRFDITMSKRKYGGELQGIEPATYLEDWEILLEKVITKRYKLSDESGRDMGIIMVTCDSGGTFSSTTDSSVTENSYKFWRRCKELGLSGKFNLIKGTRPAPSSNTPAIRRSVLTKQSSTAKKAKVVGQLPLWLLNTTIIKDTVMAKMKKVSGDGIMFFPEWLPSWFYRELTSEVRTDKGWENLRGRRNEAFDLVCYAHAGNLILVDRYWSGSINWDIPPQWAKEWDENSEVSDSGKFIKEEVVRTAGRVVRGSSRNSRFR
jgi:phage terminase large subunit GpA-like protein